MLSLHRGFLSLKGFDHLSFRKEAFACFNGEILVLNMANITLQKESDIQIL